jgi:hypothetical protein
VEYLTLAAGLLLPWALGIALLLVARDPATPLDAPGECAWIAGAGYLAGAISLTLWMRLLSLAGIAFGIASIAFPLVAIAAALVYAAVRRAGGTGIAAPLRRALVAPLSEGIARVLWWLAIGWIALRFALLGLEIASRPLFPWEAWIGWATKARVWFELERITPFADADAWFAAGGSVFFDAAPGNPATLPLLQVWACIALGRWDDALMNWPWLQFAVALALLVYGGLRRLDATAPQALVASYFVTSLPLANAHVALAGYADLPLAVSFAAAALALLKWGAKDTARDAVLAVLFAACCPLVKPSGAVWALALLPGAVVVLAPRRGLRIVAFAAAVVVSTLTVLAQTRFVIAGHSLRIDFAPSWGAFADSAFLLGNWHLLWYGTIGVAALAARQLLAPGMRPLTTITAAALLVVAVVFAFPGIGQRIGEAPGIDRTMLQAAPLLIAFIVLGWRAFAGRWQAPPAGTIRAAASAD